MANKSSEHMALPRRYKKMLALIPDEIQRTEFKKAMIDAHKHHMEFVNRRSREDANLPELVEVSTEGSLPTKAIADPK
ncbi:MAG: hypothetical protein ACRDFB_10575 [Rhabdochlamydiaceae bacterium]